MASGEDFAVRMRAIIESETVGNSDPAPLVAERIVEKLRATDPELLAGWLNEHAVAIITRAISKMDRSARTLARRITDHPVFADAAERGEVARFLDVRYVVDDELNRLRLRDMTADHLKFVADKYEESARVNRMEAAFMAALAKKLRKNETVGDRFTDNQVEALRRSIVIPAA